MQAYSSPTLLANARIVTLDDADRVIDRGAVLVGTDGRVADLGATDEVRGRAPRDAEVVDAGGRVVLPGLVNAHTHLYSTLARGMALLPGRAPPGDFKAILEEIWWPLDRALDLDDVYVSALIGLSECVRAGVTTVIDHHASEGAVDGSLDAIARAASALGIRISTCFETTDRDGPAVAKAGIAENARFAREVARWAEPRGGVATRAASFGLHASLTLSDATLERAVGEARDAGLDSFHVHVAESVFDPADALKKSGVRTVERLRRAGILGPRTLAVHCVHVDDREVAALAETRTLVATNPSSNRNNSVGTADVARLLRAGVRVALGTDGMRADILAELAQAFLQTKDVAGDPRPGWDETRALLRNDQEVARALFGARLGLLEKGGPADLVVLDYDPWTPFEGSTWLGHVLYGDLGSKVRDVLCGGRWVLRGGAIVSNHADLDGLSARARERARALWARRRV